MLASRCKQGTGMLPFINSATMRSYTSKCWDRGQWKNTFSPINTIFSSGLHRTFRSSVHVLSRSLSKLHQLPKSQNILSHNRPAWHSYRKPQAALSELLVRWYSPPSETTLKAKARGIQKDVSPLTTKRVVRRKKTKDSLALDKEVFDVTAFAPSEEINLENLAADLGRQGLYLECKLPNDVVDALHVEAKYRVDNDSREIFFFREGAIVFWNMPEVERNAVLKFVRRHQTDSYDSALVLQEYEHVEFTFTGPESPTQLVGDEIQLRRPLDAETEIKHHQLEKYTYSNALALGVKLSVWEESLQRYVESIEWVLQDLRDGKKIRISRGDVLRKTGELFTLRHLINLSSDLLDTPDFYWDRDRLEPLYSQTCSYLSIARRTKVMNEKLTHCCELADLLISHLNDKHHTRLEWMIIILIMVEVLFEIVHMVERAS